MLEKSALIVKILEKLKTNLNEKDKNLLIELLEKSNF